jgi:hypothetical protein
MTSFKPSSAVDVWSTAKSCSSSNIHSILNPIQSAMPSGASQQGSDLYRSCHSPCFESSQADWTDSFPRQAQTGILIHGSSQKSCPQATALHAASLGRSSHPETVKPQQHPFTVKEVDTMEPGPFTLPPLSTSSPKPRMFSMEALQSVHSQDASRHTSQSSSNHISRLSIAPHYGITVPQQSSMAHQASTHQASTHQASTHQSSFPTPVEPLALSSPDALGPRAQSSYSFESPDGLIQIPVDLESGSRSSGEKRKRNAGASARFRQRRKEKELENAHNIAELEQRVRDLTKICKLYREQRDHFYNLSRSGGDPRTGGLQTPSSGFSDKSYNHLMAE